MEIIPEIQKALQKIEEKFGIVPHNGVFIYKASGKTVKKSDDRERMNLIFDSMADCTLSDVERMIQNSADRSDDTALVVPQTLIPILDGRLVRPEANELDRDLLHCLRVPYAEDREARTIAREDGCLVYVEGQKASRVASECLRVSLPQSIVREIDAKTARYQASANAALLQIAGECTRAGSPEAIHQRITDWMLDNVPTCMIPEQKGLQIRAIKRGRGEAIPCEIVGWLDPIEALEKKKTITQNSDFFVKNLKSLSNDPTELAITHIDLTSLPDGETPAWNEMQQKFTDDEWSVLCAYIWATFDMTNFSRQALVLYDNGHTGKSTLFAVLAWALGGKENCAYPDPLLSPKDDKFYTSQYYGKHVVFIPDCKNPNLLRTGWIHSYTGGDTVSIQYKGRNAFSARCYGKAFIATNTIPSLDVQAEHIKTRLIILRPQLTQEAIERLGQRDSHGEFIRDESGKILIKGDPQFETHLKEEFWAFLKKCRAVYNRLCPDGCTIQLPQSVRENNDIAEDIVTTRVLELCDEIFTFDLDSDGKARKCPCKDFYKAIDEALEQHTIRGVDCAKVINILSENRGVVKKKIRVGEKTMQGFVGLALRDNADLDDLFDPHTHLDSFRLSLCDIDTSDL